MDDNNKATVSFSIDMKKDRLRIHRATLNQLGQPKYIQILVNPNDKIVAFRGLEKRSKETHTVNYSFFRSDTSFELYSKNLVATLMSLFPDLERDCTYRLTGEVYIDKKVVFFPLSTLQRVEGGI